MSGCTMPMLAANIAVVPPTIPTTASAVGAYSKSGDRRATMKTPAVTIVAAWINAETGVGPSIASGSQVCSGICADLAAAPINSATQMPKSSGERIAESDRVHGVEDQQNGEHDADVADDVDDERLAGGGYGRRFKEPEADQEVRGESDEPPADKQPDEVIGEHQREHREDEEIHV